MRHRAIRIALVLGLLAFAVVARAATEAQVAADASALRADYQALEQRVNACPGGECSDATDIRATYAALEIRRLQLHLDRATLPSGCGCEQIDSDIALIDQLSASLGGTMGGWEEES